MQKFNLTRQVIAFVAAGVIVLTAVDVWVVWRNQSADRVMQTKGGQVLYESNDYAVGSLHQGQTDVATVLRLSPDGGWSLQGSGPWLDPSEAAPYGQIALIQSLASGPIDSYWLCAVTNNPKLTSVELYNVQTHKVEDQYELHHGGLIEPVMLHPGTEVRLQSGNQILTVLTITLPQAP